MSYASDILEAADLIAEEEGECKDDCGHYTCTSIRKLRDIANALKEEVLCEKSGFPPTIQLLPN